MPISMITCPTFNGSRPPVSRFAPSPNGRLHLGHALSALMAHDVARQHLEGRYIVRIEDIDAGRSRAEHVDQIMADLDWLGLSGDEPPLFQSSRISAYAAALDNLKQKGLTYRCFCTRADIARALKDRPVLHGPDGPAYPGTCRKLSDNEADERVEAGMPFCWRLKMSEAVNRVGSPGMPVGWIELGSGRIDADPRRFGDIVLWRKDAPTSYHLAVTVDDAWQRIDPVVRGRDLYEYTAVHRLLQKLLDYPEPSYWHHPLLLGPDGEKLAKRDRSPALARYREAGTEAGDLLSSLRSGRLPSGISLGTD